MDVLPDNEQEEIFRGIRRFLEKESPPSLVKTVQANGHGYSSELWQKIAAMDWLGVSLPQRYGGQGLHISFLGLLLEEIGRHLAPVPFLSTAVAAHVIEKFGTSEQKDSILPEICAGRMILTFAIQELDDPRLLPDAVTMSCDVEGDHVVVSGSKAFVDNGLVADRCIVVCRTDVSADPRNGLSLLLVELTEPGISRTPLVSTARDQQSILHFNNVVLPRSALIGDVNNGWLMTQELVTHAAAYLSAQLVGAARKDLEMAVTYAKSRVAFGQPIGSFQSIQHLCADMLIGIDGAQLLTREAIWKLGEGLPAEVEARQAKSFASEKCLEACRSSQQIHGGLGFMLEFDLHLWYEHVASWSMRMGTSIEHRGAIANALFENPGPLRLGVPLAGQSA